MRKVELWELSGYNGNVIIPAKEVTNAAYVENIVFIDLSRQVDEEDIDLLNRLLKNRNKLVGKELNDEVEDLIRALFPGEAADFTYFSEEWVDKEHTLYFDIYNQVFGYFDEDFDDCFRGTFHFWNGHNYETLINYEGDEERTTVDDYVSIDKWDGHNKVTGGIGEHVYIYPCQDPEHKGLFLIDKWSQWEGSLSTGKIVDKLDLIEYLKDNDRNPDEYLPELEKMTEGTLQ